MKSELYKNILKLTNSCCENARRSIEYILKYCDFEEVDKNSLIHAIEALDVASVTLLGNAVGTFKMEKK